MTTPTPDTTIHTERYEDRGRLGIGASADVRRVWDRRLSREVALKVVRADRLDDPRAYSRLVREAAIIGNVHHNGIPAVYDRDELSDGRPFFTMRAIRGSSLMDLTIAFHKNKGPGGPGGREELVDLAIRMWEVADAVDGAHEAGLLHRDLKLANVMIPFRGAAQVVDWGLAVDLRTPPTRLRRAGTRGYMAPEQEQALSSALAPTADVYSMGEMLARILYGAGHETAQPFHPAHAPPIELARVCAIARMADPLDRYESAGAFRDALGNAIRHLDVRPLQVRPRLAS